MLVVDPRSVMARKTVEERLEEYNERHRDLAAQIARDRDHCRWERDSPIHPLHLGRLPVQRRPAYSSRALLAVDGKGERQDRDQATDCPRGGPLSRVDRQRSPHPCPARSDPQSRRQGGRTSVEGSCQRVGRGFNCKLRRCSVNPGLPRWRADPARPRSSMPSSKLTTS